MSVILQSALPDAQLSTSGLPGTLPCAPDDWLRVDEAYAAQMAYRKHLIEDRPTLVLSEGTTTLDAGNELLDEALKILPELGFICTGTEVTCPDGRVVSVNRNAPLHTLGHLVQEDICLLEKRGDEHVMTSAVLCFPAGWHLAEKIDRPLTIIHDPVDSYDENIGRRVQRLFDGVQVGRPLWRFNKLQYADADLHQPYKSEGAAETPFIRSERQCILRLPKTDAVVFTIHTYVVHA